MIRGKAPSPGTLNNGFIILFNFTPRKSIIFVWLNNSHAIKNGNNAGTTEVTQRDNPSFEAVKLSLENAISPGCK